MSRSRRSTRSLRAGVRDDVRRILGQANTTTLLVTHNQDEALSIADLVAVLRDSTIVQCAPPRGLYAAPGRRRPGVVRRRGEPARRRAPRRLRRHGDRSPPGRRRGLPWRSGVCGHGADPARADHRSRRPRRARASGSGSRLQLPRARHRAQRGARRRTRPPAAQVPHARRSGPVGGRRGRSHRARSGARLAEPDCCSGWALVTRQSGSPAPMIMSTHRKLRSRLPIRKAAARDRMDDRAPEHVAHSSAPGR